MAAATITILHVSDMQFGRNHRFGRLGLGGADEQFDTLLKRLTDDLDKLRSENGLAPDLVTLTGDLAEWGMKKEYEDVLRFCEGVQQHLKLDHDRILVVPGNHDINRKLCEACFAECEGNGDKPVEPYWPKWKPYVEFFGKLYKDVERYEFKETAPYTWFELPALKLVVAGLNSTMRESHKERDVNDPASVFGHYGYLGERQLDWFKSKLEEAERKGWLRIGLVHHNALRGAQDDDENLRDAELLKDRLGAGLNLLLHGHTHNGSLGWLGHNLPVISTGSAAVKTEQRPEEIPNQYQIIQVRRDRITTWARQYTPSGRKWIGDPRVSVGGGEWYHKQRLDLPHTEQTFGAREPRGRGRRGAAKSSVKDDPDERLLRFDREPHDLLAEVMDSCRVRDDAGRVQTTRVRGDGPFGDYCRVTDPARGTYLLGAHPGPLTLEFLDCWVKDVHEPFRSRGNPGRTSDLVISSPSVFTDEARARAGGYGVQLYRRIDYENVIDTERWKEAQLARLDRDAEYPRGLYIEQRVELWSPADNRSADVHPAADRAVELLCGDSGCFVVVLGAAGTGKTFLLREVARRMTERQSLVTPIVVDLRGLDRALDVFQLVSWEFARCPMPLPPRAFERDLRDGRIALLFDGFDELANRVRSAAIPEHFRRIVSAAQERARILVASRSEHFTSHADALGVLLSGAAPSTGLAGQFQSVAQRRLIVTQQFTEEDIEAYLGRALGSPEAGRERMRRFGAVQDLRGLAATPRMLSFLIRLTDEQLDAAAKREVLSPSALYRLVIVDHWLAQQEQRLNPPGGAPGPTREALLESVKRLALQLWRSTARTIAATDLEASTGEQLRRLCDDDAAVATHVLQSRTLLTHGEDGQLAFVHQTVMEWLVGLELAEQIKANHAAADLDSGRLSDFLIDVLRDLLGEDPLARWANETLAGGSGNRLAENARLVLARMGRQARQGQVDLRGQDLRGQSLAGQDLRGALLDDADLRGVDLAGRDLSGASLQRARLVGADLRRAILTSANLEGADLSFTRLDRAHLGGVRWSGAVLLGTRSLGTQIQSAGADAYFCETAAWDVAPRSFWPVPAGSACEAVALSPDDRLIATGHADGLVRIWDADRTTLLQIMEGHTDWVRSVAWRPDGKRIASGSDDMTVRLWDVTTGKALRTLEGHNDWVQSVAWSPDGTRLASGSCDNTVRLWDVATGKTLRTLVRHSGWVSSVAWSPDGTRLASGSDDKTVRLWNLDTGKTLRILAGHSQGIQSVAWSPDGTHLASGSDDKTVRLWNLDTGKTLRTLEGHSEGGVSVAWSPDGTRLASGSNDKTVRLWNVATGKTLRIVEGHSDVVRSVAWNPDGTRLASGSHDETMRLWDVATGSMLHTVAGHSNWVQSVAWSPDGTRLASGSYDQMVRLWDVATGKSLRTLAGHRNGVQSVAWSPDSTCLASGSYDNKVRLWDAATGKTLRTLAGHSDGVRSVAWSPDGTRLASGSDDKTVRLWDVATGKTLRTLERHSSWVQSVAWSPDGTCLASGSRDKTVRLWDVATGKTLRTLERSSSWVQSVAWSHDGMHLASGSYDKRVHLWDVATGRMPRTLARHSNWVQSVAWSPDGTRLASGSSDTTVRLWDLATGKAQLVLRGHLGLVTSVAWSPDGRFLVSSGSDGTLRIWSTATGECLAVHVATPNGGSIVYRPSDGRYRVSGDPAGRVAYTIGLARYELGELDEFVPGGLRLGADERLVPL